MNEEHRTIMSKRSVEITFNNKCIPSFNNKCIPSFKTIIKTLNHNLDKTFEYIVNT